MLKMRILYKSAVEFFVGDAFAWFKRIKTSGSVKDWPSLVERLKKDFLSQDQDEDIWNQIKSRKQRRNESIHIFVSHLDTLFNRLSRPPAEVSKVRYVRQNLLPDYSSHLALSDIASVEDLVNLCRKIEENPNLKNKLPANQIPSTSSVCFLDNDSCPKDNNSYSFQSKQNINKNKSFSKHKTQQQSSFQNSNKSQETNLNKTKKEIVCWNCDQVNHTFGDCRLKRKTFCYKCGTKNVKFSSCPNYTKNF